MQPTICEEHSYVTPGPSGSQESHCCKASQCHSDPASMLTQSTKGHGTKSSCAPGATKNFRVYLPPCPTLPSVLEKKKIDAVEAKRHTQYLKLFSNWLQTRSLWPHHMPLMAGTVESSTQQFVVPILSILAYTFHSLALAFLFALHVLHCSTDSILIFPHHY